MFRTAHRDHSGPWRHGREPVGRNTGPTGHEPVRRNTEPTGHEPVERCGMTGTLAGGTT